MGYINEVETEQLVYTRGKSRGGFSGDGFVCENANECVEQTHECHEYAYCTDTGGGYECACIEGYAGDGYDCSEDDVCEDNNCGEDGQCVATGETYACACNAGHEDVGGGMGPCRDINECVTGQHTCGAGGTCENTKGSFACGCDAGFIQEGDKCFDIDECNTGTKSTCHHNAI